MANKVVKEECMGCRKMYALYAKGSVLGEIHYGRLKNGYVDHEHICLCPKCSKDVIKFFRDHFGKMKEFPTLWKIGRRDEKSKKQKAR